MSDGEGTDGRGSIENMAWNDYAGNPNSGSGWETTTDPGGWTVNHYTGNDSSDDQQDFYWGGGSDGSCSDNGGINLSLFPEAQAAIAAGVPMNISVIDGLWGFTFLKSKTVTSAIEAGLSRLMGLAVDAAPYAGRFAGVVVGSLLPGTIARDDPRYMGPIQDRIVQALLAEKVTDVPPAALPVSGAVLVNARIRDIVTDKKQQIAVVRAGKSQPAEQVQVVQAVETQRKDVYQVTLAAGMPPVHIRLSDQSQLTISQPASVMF